MTKNFTILGMSQLQTMTLRTIMYQNKSDILFNWVPRVITLLQKRSGISTNISVRYNIGVSFLWFLLWINYLSDNARGSKCQNIPFGERQHIWVIIGYPCARSWCLFLWNAIFLSSKDILRITCMVLPHVGYHVIILVILAHDMFILGYTVFLLND